MGSGWLIVDGREYRHVVYRPAQFAEDRPEVVVDLLRRAAFGHVVVDSADGLASTPMPLLVDVATDGRASRIRGHLARGNPLWRIAPCAALIIVPGVDAYVSPTWYAAKRAHGRVVPTWNYDVVHVHGRLEAHDDPDWTEQVVRDLTALHEHARVPPWAVDDAPAPFVIAQLRAIVGLEVLIERIEAKRKLSQNRDAADRTGARAGLEADGTPRSTAVAEAMREVEEPRASER